MRLDSESRAGPLAFLTAFTTLFAQVLVHRVIAAKLLNNYAFLVISLTMFGFALSGVLLNARLARVLARLDDVAAASAAVVVASLVLVVVVFYKMPVGPQFALTRAELLRSLLVWIPFSLVFSVPFAGCGFVLGALLASPRLSAGRIYAWDLAGSSIGAFAVLAAISAVGVEASLLLLGAVFLLGTCVLARPSARRAQASVAAAAILLVLSAVSFRWLFAMRYPDLSMLANASTPGSGMVIEHIAWDPTARIEVSRVDPPSLNGLYPSLIGTSEQLRRRIVRMITQNNWAFTWAPYYDGTKESLGGIDRTIYAAAYQASSVRRPRVMVIGVGGGTDVLTALAFDASHVTAAEINGATVRILEHTYRDYFHAWVSDPRVDLRYGEGRHELALLPGQLDVIQLSGVDSFAGTAAAAHVFSESYLYTEQAFDLYVAKLADDGVLGMVRMERFPPQELLRVLTTAVGALRRAGAQHPSDHLLMALQNNGCLGALLMKRSPFSPEEVARFRGWADGCPFIHLAAAPALNPMRGNVYQVFLSLDDPAREEEFLLHYPADIVPVTDERPFFFHFSSWRHVLTSDPEIRRWSMPAMEYSVLILGASVGLAAALCVLLPLRRLSGDGWRVPHATRYAVYFAGAGLGYMAVEIALLQRFGLFLGHPNYALSVVLAALLLASGIGSAWSGRFVRRLGNMRLVSYLLSVVLIAEILFVLPELPRGVVWPFPARVLAAFLLILPVGVLLGVFVPFALEQIKAGSAPFVPWAWGINAIFSVLGPVLAIAVSISWGNRALLLAAIPCYLLVGAALPPRSGPRTTGPVPTS